MENLQAYAGSDSDSDSSQETDNKGKLWDKMQESDLTSSLFGIEAPTLRVLENKSSSEDRVREHSEHKQEDLKTDIPDGEFWKGFSPDTNNLEPRDCSTVKKDNECGMKMRHHSSADRQRGRRKRQHVDDFSLVAENNKHIYQSAQKFPCSSSDIISSQQCPSVMQKEKRKIFYVHSKVSPYLNTQAMCKCASQSNASWPSHEKAVNRLEWNRPNYSHLLLSAGMDSTVKVWNVWSSLDQCVTTLKHHCKAVRHAIWGFQGKDVISCGYDRMAIVTDIESGLIKSRHSHPGFVMACTLHPCTPNCFVTGTENVIEFWDQRTPLSPVKSLTFKDMMGQPQDLLFIQNGRELISCNDMVSRDSADRTIMAWDVKSGNVLSNQIYQERYTCTRLKQSPSDSNFLAQTQGGYVALFSTNKPYKMNKNKRFEGHEMQGYNIGFDISQDGSLVYSGSAHGGVHCYDYRSGKLIRKLAPGNNSVITDVACHPVLPTLIAACSWGGSISLWQ